MPMKCTYLGSFDIGCDHTCCRGRPRNQGKYSCNAIIRLHKEPRQNIFAGKVNNVLKRGFSRNQF